MLIFDIRDTKRQPLSDGEQQVQALLAEKGVAVEHVAPAVWTLGTVFELLARFKRGRPDVLIAHNAKQVIACLSVINGNKSSVRLYLQPEPGDRKPDLDRSWASQLSGVLFASARQQAEAQEAMQKRAPQAVSAVVPLPVVEGGEASEVRPSLCPEKVNMLWKGHLRDTQRLEALLHALLWLPAELKPRVSVKISGQGSARDVMPLVRLTRQQPEVDVMWLGEEDFDNSVRPEARIPRTEAGPQCTETIYADNSREPGIEPGLGTGDIDKAIIQTGWDPTIGELEYARQGIPMITEPDAVETARLLAMWLSEPGTFYIARCASQAVYEQHRPRFHVEQLLQALT